MKYLFIYNREVKSRFGLASSYHSGVSSQFEEFDTLDEVKAFIKKEHKSHDDSPVVITPVIIYELGAKIPFEIKYEETTTMVPTKELNQYVELDGEKIEIPKPEFNTPNIFGV